MSFKDCYNFQDFRSLAKSKIPSPIFNYIDGAADDEVTYRRNTSSYDDVSLIPNVLRGVKDVDISTTIFGKKLDMPVYCSPTAVQRLFHFEGERAVAKAACLTASGCKSNVFSPFVASTTVITPSRV